MIAEFLSIAAMAFGAAPCGTPHVIHVPFPDPDTSLARTMQFGVPSLAPGYEWAACTIALREPSATFGLEITESWDDLDATMRCTLIVHEYGHLVGHTHSPDPHNVMYGTLKRPYWRCTARWLKRYRMSARGGPVARGVVDRHGRRVGDLVVG